MKHNSVGYGSKFLTNKTIYLFIIVRPKFEYLALYGILGPSKSHTFLGVRNNSPTTSATHMLDQEKLDGKSWKEEDELPDFLSCIRRCTILHRWTVTLIWYPTTRNARIVAEILNIYFQRLFYMETFYRYIRCFSSKNHSWMELFYTAKQLIHIFNLLII